MSSPVAPHVRWTWTYTPPTMPPPGAEYFAASAHAEKMEAGGVGSADAWLLALLHQLVLDGVPGLRCVDGIVQASGHRYEVLNARVIGALAVDLETRNGIPEWLPRVLRAWALARPRFNRQQYGGPSERIPRALALYAIVDGLTAQVEHWSPPGERILLCAGGPFPVRAEVLARTPRTLKVRLLERADPETPVGHVLTLRRTKDHAPYTTPGLSCPA